MRGDGALVVTVQRQECDGNGTDCRIVEFQNAGRYKFHI